MDALLALTTISLVVVVLAALSSTLGVDSRDGFADDSFRPFLR
jgi:hypothetical protein